MTKTSIKIKGKLFSPQIYDSENFFTVLSNEQMNIFQIFEIEYLKKLKWLMSV